MSALYPDPILNEGSFLIPDTVELFISYYPGPGTLSLFSFITSFVLDPITYDGPSAVLDGMTYVPGAGVEKVF